MAESRKKRPRDPIALAQLVEEIATGQVETREDDDKDADAAELGRRGGLKGGRAQAERPNPERRREITRKAAATRWHKRRPLHEDQYARTASR